MGRRHQQPQPPRRTRTPWWRPRSPPSKFYLVHNPAAFPSLVQSLTGRPTPNQMSEPPTPSPRPHPMDYSVVHTTVLQAGLSGTSPQSSAPQPLAVPPRAPFDSADDAAAQHLPAGSVAWSSGIVSMDGGSCSLPGDDDWPWNCIIPSPETMVEMERGRRISAEQNACGFPTGGGAGEDMDGAPECNR